MEMEGENGRLPHGRRGLKWVWVYLITYVDESPSSRKAGIEILIFASRIAHSSVAFLTEGGD